MKIYFDETQKERGKIDTNYSILRDSLRNEGFTVEAFNNYPIEGGKLDCDVLVFACPDGSKLYKNEAEIIVNYVEKGGGLLVISNAGGDRGLRTNMNEILNHFNIEILSDQVKDEKSNEFNMPTHPVITDIREHPITEGVSEIVIVAGCSVRGSSNMTALAFTAPNAEPPSAPVAIAGEVKKGRVTVVGSYRLFSNYGAGISLRNNRRFAINIVKWLGRAETKIGIEKTVETERVTEKKEPASLPTVTTPPPTPTPAATTTVEPKEALVSSSPETVSPPTTSRAPTETAPVTRPLSIDESSVFEEIERLRSDISEMREIIARLYADSLGYLQEMKEEVRTMLDYLRTKDL